MTMFPTRVRTLDQKVMPWQEWYEYTKEAENVLFLGPKVSDIIPNSFKKMKT